MPAKIPDDRAWVIKHLQPLMDAGMELQAFDESLPDRVVPQTYDAGPWTGLKLIALKNYIPPYLNILGDMFPLAYIDLFAGPGLDRIGEHERPIPGSPLIPLMIQDAAKGRMFKHLFLCEKERQFEEALRRRVGRYLPPGVGRTIHQGDANDFVKQLPRLLKSEDIGHSLVFLDPEGLQWHWDSMVYLLQNVTCDVIVNFPSTGILRISTKEDVATRRTIAEYLGVPLDELPRPINMDWAIRRYRDGLGELGRDVSTEIKVAANGAFHYHLIPAVRKTAGGSPWFSKILEPMRKRIEGMHGGVLSLIAEQIAGDQASLYDVR